MYGEVLPRVLVDAMEDLALMQLHTFHLCLDVLCKSKAHTRISEVAFAFAFTEAVAVKARDPRKRS